MERTLAIPRQAVGDGRHNHYVTSRHDVRYNPPVGVADDAPVSGALRNSFLAGVPDATRARVLAGAQVVSFPPNQVLIDGESQFAGIVVAGLLRVYLDSGQEGITIRNVGPGEAVGIGAMIGERDHVWVQSVSRVMVLRLDLRRLAAARGTDADLNLALARECFHRSRDTAAELALRIHGRVRQRLARQILDIAARYGTGEPVTVRVTHAQLAEAIGSQREVVSRALAGLTATGVISRQRGSIVVLDPVGLRELAVAA